MKKLISWGVISGLVLFIIVSVTQFVTAQNASDTSAPAATDQKKEPPEEITFTRTGNAAPSLFKHGSHGEANSCDDCHAGEKPLFPQKRSEEVYKMADMYAGKTCGACHDGKKAFEAKKSCAKCHNQPKK